jgi:chromosomal replication initiator protein
MSAEILPFTDPFDIGPIVPVALPSRQYRYCEIARIQAVVAASYEINPNHMKSAERWRDVAWPRQVAMYLSRRLTKQTTPCIGRQFGNRDHSTVLHAIKAVERRMACDPLYRADVEALQEALSQ